MVQFIALACVLGIAAGQVLFKMSANAASDGAGILSPKALSILIVALGVYGVTTLAWVWVLRKSELGKIYPLMALAFVFVPLGSYFILGERFAPRYFAGILLIVVGIIVSGS